MSTNDFEFDPNAEFEGIGCMSVEDVELPAASSSFFNPTEGKPARIRMLQGPVLSYVSQEWDNGQPVGDKVKYKYDDPAAKKDANAKLVMTFLVYNYADERVQLWEITQKSVLEDIKAINSMQPDLSAFDIQVTKSKKSNGFMDYKIVQGVNKPFENAEVIAEVKEKGLRKRLAEMDKDSDEQTSIDSQIAEAKAADPAASRAAHAQKIKDKDAEETARIKAEAEEVFQ